MQCAGVRFTMQAMRVLVTGGAGFIGSHIVHSLLGRGVEVAVLDNLLTGHRHNLPPEAVFYQVDLRDRQELARVMAQFRPTHISHQAAQSSVKISVDQPLLDAGINLIGGIHLLEEAVRANVEQLVFASTGGALYGEVPADQRAAEHWPARPKSPYAGSKAAFEVYLEVYRQTFGLSSTVLRYGNVYGPRQDPHGEAGVVAIFAGRMLDGKPLRINARHTEGDDGCVRDYIHVDDVVEANWLALRGGLEGTYNVGTGQGHTTRDILQGLMAALEVQSTIEYGPPRAGDLERSVLDPARLLAAGWRPQVDFAEGIQQTAHWFRAARQAP